MTWKDSYYGWLIELIPSSEGYVFKCWMPDEQIGISNYHVYPRVCQAIRAARKRAKLESASLALMGFLNESYNNCRLSSQEHIALMISISDYTASVGKPKIRRSLDLADE
ncbi:hypothetical protein A6770_07870 [Nostoc minutum NIES-26]|uniref:Uncharacterized protein n=1 Tax=Nostoc minutum NIES-26 TaxID=1844469 RepID=A0A367RZZ2_9NOSO|nr:hypothetical protein A6770_07870 [Nostoc minutum NIES-26]